MLACHPTVHHALRNPKTAPLLALARMRHGVGVLESLDVEVGVYLCRLERAMAEELLYLAQVTTLVQHPCSKRMS